MKKTKMKAFTLVEMALTKNRQNLVSAIKLTVKLQAKRPLYLKIVVGNGYPADELSDYYFLSIVFKFGNIISIQDFLRFVDGQCGRWCAIYLLFYFFALAFQFV